MMTFDYDPTIKEGTVNTAPPPKLPTTPYCPGIDGMCETLGESARRERLLIESVTATLHKRGTVTLNDQRLFCGRDERGERSYAVIGADDGWQAAESAEAAIEAALSAAGTEEGASHALD